MGGGPSMDRDYGMYREPIGDNEGWMATLLWRKTQGSIRSLYEPRRGGQSMEKDSGKYKEPMGAKGRWSKYGERCREV